MRRLIGLAIAALAVMTLCSCGDGDGSGSVSEENATGQNEFTLNYYKDRNCFIIEDYVGKASEVVIPKDATIDGITAPISIIGKYAFYKRAHVTSVRLSENIHTIEDFAFAESGLKTLVTTGRLVNMGEHFLDNCPVEFHVKDEVSYLPSIYGKYGYAMYFQGTIPSYKDHKTIELPKECVGIYDRVFDIFYEVKITSSYMQAFGSVAGVDESPYVFANGVSMNKIITKAGSNAFYNKDYVPTNLTILEGTTSIGSYAFCNCESMRAITIPSTVTTINDGAFNGCHSLYVGFNGSAFSGRNWGENDIYGYIDRVEGYLYYENGAYYRVYDTDDGKKAEVMRGVDSLETIAISSQVDGVSVTSIGDYAFQRCAVASISIPDSIRFISSSAFFECPSLSYTIEAGVKYLGNAGNPHHALIDASGVTEIEIHPDTKVIAGEAFMFSEFSSIVIPDGLLTIGDEAFCDQHSLHNVTLPDSLTYIGYRAFYGCWSLESIFIPSSVAYVGSEAFSGCSGLSRSSIYCQASSLPSSWKEDWNPDNVPVIWGYSPEA